MLKLHLPPKWQCPFVISLTSWFEGGQFTVLCSQGRHNVHFMVHSLKSPWMMQRVVPTTTNLPPMVEKEGILSSSLSSLPPLNFQWCDFFEDIGSALDQIVCCLSDSTVYLHEEQQLHTKDQRAVLRHDQSMDSSCVAGHRPSPPLLSWKCR